MKIRDALRMREMDVSNVQISRSMQCGRSTIIEIFRRCDELGLDFSQASQMSNTDLDQLLYPPTLVKEPEESDPDFVYIQKQMDEFPRLNRKFMWEEYFRRTPDPLQYSQFCKRFRTWRKENSKEVTLIAIFDRESRIHRVVAKNLLSIKYFSQESAITVANTIAAPLSIGDSYQGGIIAYIDGTGQHGLIAAPSDQSTGISWDNGSITTTGATATALGTGMANTNAIIVSQGEGSYAASLCRNSTLGGYSDWYLPSKDELNTLWANLGSTSAMRTANGFASGYYWSSTESNSNSTLAWFQYFLNGNQVSSYKYNVTYVRAVRTF